MSSLLKDFFLCYYHFQQGLQEISKIPEEIKAPVTEHNRFEMSHFVLNVLPVGPAVRFT